MTSTKKPNFFIVGAPKCGTSALNQYLSEHPDIFLGIKEMHFFGSDLPFGPQLQFYRRYPNEYFGAFARSNGQARIGEASVWYLFSQRAATEIKSFNPDARIIIMLRNPVEMLHSLYSQFRADGNEHLSTFEEALAAEEDRRAGRRINRQTYLPSALEYRATARFTEQVKRYYEAFGRERVHVIIFDDLRSDTAGVYRKTLEFLEVPTNCAPREFEVINGNVNGNDSVRSPLLRAVMSDRSLREGVVNLRKWLPRPVFTAVKNAGVKLGQLNAIPHSGKRQPMAADLQKSLCREFAAEIESLSSLLGRDLTHWTQAGAVRQPLAA